MTIQYTTQLYVKCSYSKTTQQFSVTNKPETPLSNTKTHLSDLVHSPWHSNTALVLCSRYIYCGKLREHMESSSATVGFDQPSQEEGSYWQLADINTFPATANSSGENDRQINK